MKRIKREDLKVGDIVKYGKVLSKVTISTKDSLRLKGSYLFRNEKMALNPIPIYLADDIIKLFYGLSIKDQYDTN